MKKLLTSIIVSAALIGSGAYAELKKIKLGVSPGPHQDMALSVQKLAKDKNLLDIEVVVFNDYVTPNAALNSGDIDANSFQHKPYLDNEIENNGYKLTPVADNLLFPMSLYSKKIKSKDELKDGDTVVIQNDPTNGGRALLLLESEGVIEVADEAGLTPTIADITSNPKNLKFVAVSAQQTLNYLQDVALVSINTDYITIDSNVSKDDAVISESANSPYMNIVVVRTEDKDADWVKELVKLYHSDEVKAMIQKAEYANDVVIGW
ncbi:MAG: MetQ/NlpA family ABC transporter substrate-binding protein [Alphaproteobacteria bacterium]